MKKKSNQSHHHKYKLSIKITKPRFLSFLVSLLYHHDLKSKLFNKPLLIVGHSLKIIKFALQIFFFFA